MIHHSSLIIHHSSFIIPPSAVTLIEMLVVLVIISILAVAALRALPGEGDRTREAARMINVYLGSARIRTMETGRPAGVIFQRFPNRPDACTTLQQCEVPPPYAGDMLNAVVRVQDWSYRPERDSNFNLPIPYWDNTDRLANKLQPLLITYVVKLWVRPNDFSPGVLRRGDLIQLIGQNLCYTVSVDDGSRRTVWTPPPVPMPMTPPPDFPVDANGYIDFSQGSTNSDGWIDNYVLTLILDARMLQNLPWPKYTDGLLSQPIMFNILRQPVKSAVQPLQLPANTAVDLAYSGSLGFSFRNGVVSGSPPASPPVTVLFSPNGSVEGVYCQKSGTTPGTFAATQPINLLVGRLDRIKNDSGVVALSATPNEDDKPNWADLKSMWISIQPQTGLISTAEMYPIDWKALLNADPNFWTHTNTTTWPYVPLEWYPQILQSNAFAREAQPVGGR